ncbi:MAG: hypothetical protein H7338_17590 [Candidatus Sericytochromatia bacterium]|nr:hypothetical protein [Candidatus Sericytochromatia bacterium]
MDFRFSQLWRFDRSLDRGGYAAAGIVLMLIKYNLDRLTAGLFGYAWSPFRYLKARPAQIVAESGATETQFYGVLIALALPFIWAGLSLTIQRLRSVGLPLWLVCLFFVPVVNLFFFAALCVLPANLADQSTVGPPNRGPVKAFLDRVMPRSSTGSAGMAMLLTGFVGVLAVTVSVVGFNQYGLGIFVGMPFCLGLMAALLHAYHQRRSYRECLSVAILSVAFLALLLVWLAIEGLICIVMAAPIGLVLAIMGASVGYTIQQLGRGSSNASGVLPIIMFLLPGLMGAEAAAPVGPPVYAVVTAVEIDAPPDRVWRHVITFSELPVPDELIFRLGVAYPVRAVIKGQGVGAIRHCVFSTGPFVEPITVWDAPRLLKFDVTAQPPAMQELSPYGAINAPHLDNFLVSQGGQFALTALPGNRTRLEGTTWYHHNIWPASYWRMYSDAIIHDIHARVLDHIKHLTEQEHRG